MPPLSRLLGIVWAAAVLLLAGAAGAGAQLADLEAEYARVRAAYEDAVEERARAQELYNSTLNQVRAARSAGDEGRLADAMAGFYSQARALEELDRRLEEADRSLDEVGRRFIRVLDEREEELLEALEDAAGAQEREGVLEELAEVRRQVRSVEAEVESLQEVPILPAPDIQPDPRDGPAETRAKYNLLASRVQEFDAVLEEIDGRLEALERRLRRDRTLQDQEAGIARFDDLMIAPRAPTPGQPRPEGLPGDEMETYLGDLPLEEQIALLRILRDQAAEVRDETRAQAEEFLELIPGGVR